MLPVVLKLRSITNLQLARTGTEGFTQTDFEAINLVISQIALALDNLLAREEIDERRRQKAEELAVSGAFQNGKTMSEIAPAVAAAINELIPGIDLLSIYRVGRLMGTAPFDATVQKQNGVFMALPAEEVMLPASISPLGWEQRVAVMEGWLLQPTLNVGRQAAEARERCPVAQLYGELLGLQSSMHVPVVIKDEPVAALVVASKATYAFTSKDLQNLQALSGDIADSVTLLTKFNCPRLLEHSLNFLFLSHAVQWNSCFYRWGLCAITP